MAIALVVIALAFGVMAVALALLARRLADETRRLAQELSDLRRELHPVLRAASQLAGAGAELSGRIQEEVLAVLNTSRRVRRGVLRGIRRVEDRLADLDALYEVVHGEFQSTALDVAAALRTARRGAGVMRKIRRMLARRGGGTRAGEGSR